MASLNPHASRPTPAIRHPLPPTPAETFLSAQPTVHSSNIPEDARLCPICQEPFFSGSLSSERAVELPCHHIMGADCLATWLKEHNTCPMCRSTFFEKPAVMSSMTGPQVLAAFETFVHELLRRARLARALAGEYGGARGPRDGAVRGSESPERAVEANADDSATPRIDSSQQITGFEARALELAQVQLENRMCLPPLRGWESEAVTEEGAREISRMRDRMMEIERGIRERFRRRGLGERYNVLL
ncbi:hypothetical protein BDR22DRAFT_964879 [Usnea florida]